MPMDAVPKGAGQVFRAACAVGAAAWRAASWLLLGYLLVMVAEALVPVGVAWLTKLIVDGLARLVADGGSAAGLVGLGVGLAAAGVVAAVLPQAGSYLGGEVGRRLVVDTTDRLFAAVSRLPGLRPFENPQFLDRLRLAQDGTGMAGSTVIGAFGVGRSLVTLAGFVGSLLVVSPVMTAIVLVGAVPALVAHLHLSRWRARMIWRISPTERWQFFYSRLLGQADAAKEVRLFGSGGFLRERMMGHVRTATAVRRRRERRVLAVVGARGREGGGGGGRGAGWGVRAGGDGRLSLGAITLFIAAVAAVQGALGSLVNAVADVHHGALLFHHYLAVIRAAPDLPIAADPVPAPPLRRGIEFDDVWFRYSDEHPWVLKGVTFAIPAGRAVALVGLNGAGKSTLVKLLCRFYDPDRGAIRWDGVDLRQMRPEELRARISGVFQDHVSYDLTAEDNIVIGDVSAAGDRDRVRAAAAQAGLDDTFDRLPHGYQTLLTRMFFSEEDKADPSTGVVLSGGQWQRLALARAYFRQGRDLMILDEPSAGLD